MASSGPPAVLSRWLGTQEIKPFLKTTVCPQGGIHSPKQAVLRREVWVVHLHGCHIYILTCDSVNVQCFQYHDWMNIVHSCVILCTIIVFSFLFFLSWSFFLYLLFYVFAHYSAPNILTEYQHPALRQNPLVYPSVLFLCFVYLFHLESCSGLITLCLFSQLVEQVFQELVERAESDVNIWPLICAQSTP